MNFKIFFPQIWYRLQLNLHFVLVLSSCKCFRCVQGSLRNRESGKCKRFGTIKGHCYRNLCNARLWLHCTGCFAMNIIYVGNMLVVGYTCFKTHATNNTSFEGNLWPSEIIWITMHVHVHPELVSSINQFSFNMQ